MFLCFFVFSFFFWWGRGRVLFLLIFSRRSSVSDVNSLDSILVVFFSFYWFFVQVCHEFYCFFIMKQFVLPVKLTFLFTGLWTFSFHYIFTAWKECHVYHVLSLIPVSFPSLVANCLIESSLQYYSKLFHTMYNFQMQRYFPSFYSITTHKALSF